MESHPYLLHRQCRLMFATLFQLFGRLHIKAVLSISDLSLEPSSEQQLQAGRQDTCSSDSFSAPSGFLASASTIIISSTQSSSFLSQESPNADVFTQFASLRDSLVLRVDHLSFSWRSMSCFASLPDHIRVGRFRAALVQSRRHVHLPSILWIHVFCSDCSALLHTAKIPAETVVA